MAEQKKKVKKTTMFQKLACFIMIIVGLFLIIQYLMFMVSTDADAVKSIRAILQGEKAAAAAAQDEAEANAKLDAESKEIVAKAREATNKIMMAKLIAGGALIITAFCALAGVWVIAKFLGALMLLVMLGLTALLLFNVNKDLAVYKYIPDGLSSSPKIFDKVGFVLAPLGALACMVLAARKKPTPPPK